MTKSGKWILGIGLTIYFSTVIATFIAASTSSNKFAGIPVVMLTEPWSSIVVKVVDVFQLGWFDGENSRVIDAILTLIEACLNGVIFFIIVRWTTKRREESPKSSTPVRYRCAIAGFIVVMAYWVIPGGMEIITAPVVVMGLILGLYGRYFVVGQIAIIGAIISLLNVIWTFVLNSFLI